MVRREDWWERREARCSSWWIDLKAENGSQGKDAEETTGLWYPGVYCTYVL